ncbi:MAG: AraC family transcriptional regulator [Lachnospiraceae bacterium]|nr:AraC family transcriptional regulator [Lachnospiraceae bacterium]
MNILEYENYEEKKTHGEDEFPYITYLCTIPLDFKIVPTHWHNEYEIIYVKKGQGVISLDLEYHNVKAGDIILIVPGQLHSIEQKDEETMEYENIIFGADIIASKHNDYCYNNYFSFLTKRTLQYPTIFNQTTCKYYHDIARCIDNADEICKTFPHGYQLAIKSYLFQMFFVIFTNLPKEKPPTKKKKSLDKMKLIVKYVENNYADNITIEDMANLCDFSQSHFMKFFKNNMEVSFIEYLNNYRLTMASRLLISSSSSIIAISMESGFDNLSYFNRLFKKKYDMTPSEFRRLYQT